MQIQLPDWLASSKRIDSKKCKYYYKESLNKKLGLDSAIEKKELLIKMAQNGEKRPSASSRLGQALINYTSKSTTAYDDLFDKKIKKIAPFWFTTITELNKIRFIKMAKKRMAKPKAGTSDNNNLCYYLKKDQKFRAIIKKYCPEWIPLPFDQIRKKHEIEIEKLARSGKPIPPITTKIGGLISRYKRINKKFMEKIKKIRPDWFITQTDRVNEKKKKILELIKVKNTTRPEFLYLFTNKHSHSFDPNLNRIVRKARPEWFLSKKILNANENKIKLLELARKGAKRPNQKTTKLGSALTTYTVLGSVCYDAKFDKEIRRIAPHWFSPKFLSLPKLTREVRKNKIKSVKEYKAKRKREWPSNPPQFYKNWKGFANLFGV